MNNDGKGWKRIAVFTNLKTEKEFIRLQETAEIMV